MKLVSVKSGVLEVLEKNRGDYVSGEALAEQLSCSRTAVWKAVKGLREEGYQISSVTNRGYLLEEGNDILSAEGVCQALGTEAIPVYVYKEVDSTNVCLRQKLVNHPEFFPGEAAVLAEAQTKGKGRSGRGFSSPTGDGLYMSILVRPGKSVRESLCIRAAAAVAVYRGVKKVLGIDLAIQWVNDLYYQEHKVCGILTEAAEDFETGDIAYAIVGIGLRLFDSAQGDRGIFTRDSPKVDRNLLAAEIIRAFLEEAPREEISHLYRERSQQPGSSTVLVRDGRRERITVREILEDGRLVAEHESGLEEILTYGETVPEEETVMSR